jgi:putative ATPase
MHLRNAPTKLMKTMDYGKGYQYAHDYEGNFIYQEFMPEKIAGNKLYQPGQNASENKQREYLKYCWKEKYDY